MHPWLLGLALFIIGLHASAADLRVTFNSDKPPFAFTDKAGHLTGIELDLMQNILHRCGHKMIPISVSKAKLLSSIKNKEADIAASVQGVDGDGIFYSNDFVYYVNFAISRKESDHRIETLNDLDQHDFVIWQRGWADLGPEFEAKYKPNRDGRFPSNYFQAGTQEAQSRIFWAKRVSIIVVDKTIFEWYRRQLATKENKLDDELVYHDIFKSRTGFAVAFTDKALRDQFNLMLKAIQADGTYQKILSKYK